MLFPTITALATAKRIVVPGPGCKNIIIQNNGLVDIRIGIDGGTDLPNSGSRVNQLPTAALGIKVTAGNQFFMNYAQFPSISPRTIWAISTGGAVAIDIATDDPDSTSPLTP